jgi:hypothetical protein
MLRYDLTRSTYPTVPAYSACVVIEVASTSSGQSHGGGVRPSRGNKLNHDRCHSAVAFA